ncbi:unnamed protein product [Trypanosoma congolense IL3000]|nr:unnamed protein product [Trypanosoma congolense IL3000]
MFGPLTCRKWLHNYAEHVTEVTPRQNHLPRQPMVVSIPKKENVNTRKMLEPYLYDLPAPKAVAKGEAKQDEPSLWRGDTFSFPFESKESEWSYYLTGSLYVHYWTEARTDVSQWKWSHNVYTSTVWTGTSRYRHEPYVYDPLRDPTSIYPLQEVDICELQ